MKFIRKKNKQINFRVTEKEYNRLQKLCAKSNLPISTFLIKSALNKKIIVVNDLDKVIYELRKIGNNLNQITKLYNQRYIDFHDFKELREEFHNTWQLLNSLIQKVV